MWCLDSCIRACECGNWGLEHISGTGPTYYLSSIAMNADRTLVVCGNDSCVLVCAPETNAQVGDAPFGHMEEMVKVDTLRGVETVAMNAAEDVCAIWIGGRERASVGRGDKSTTLGRIIWTQGKGASRRVACRRKKCGIWIVGQKRAGAGRKDGSTTWGHVNWTYGTSR